MAKQDTATVAKRATQTTMARVNFDILRLASEAEFGGSPCVDASVVLTTRMLRESTHGTECLPGNRYDKLKFCYPFTRIGGAITVTLALVALAHLG